MSLVGNLEDLGLGDILQIVSLSRKSGELILQSQSREGKIIFQNGQVTRAHSTVFRENLGDLLVRRGVTDIETIKKALELQRGTKPPLRIGTILVEQFGIQKETIDTLVREQIEKIVYSFFAWGEGTFSFELGESEVAAATHFDPLQFMLDQGLNPQWLAMEGSRILDEKIHRGETLEETAEESLIDVEQMFALSSESEAAAGEGEIQPGTSAENVLILVDDDEVTRTELAEILTNRGIVVESCADARAFMRTLEKFCTAGTMPTLLIDLFIPRADGSGVLGGLELIERVKCEYPGLNVLAMSDHPNEEAERRLAAFGLSQVLRKPRKIEVRDVRGLQQLDQLGEHIKLALEGKLPAEGNAGSATFNLGAELRMEFGESETSRTSRGPESPGLHLLRGMLQELNNPALGGGIILLVLRFASELMNRAVIFLVKEEEIVGLGQFGIEPIEGEPADVRVRRMKIPRNEGSVFEDVLQSWSPMKATLGAGQWDSYLAEQLGGGLPQEVFLGPIISEGKVVALLYGDNIPERKQIGDTESLEIFLSQAGLAMEKALLERRLRGREAAA